MTPKRLAALALLACLSIAVVACGADDDDADSPDSEPSASPTALDPSASPTTEEPTTSPDDPVTSSPDPGPEQLTPPALIDARDDLAGRLGIEPGDISLVRLTAAGWNGCLGVARPDQACTDQFVGGYIAILDSGEATYRYHIGGNEFIATDFLEGEYELEDGLEVPPEIAPDFNRILAAWSRDDLALRLGLDASAIVVRTIAPVVFSDGCLGIVDPAIICAEGEVPGVVILMDVDAPDGTEYRYHASTSAVVATDLAIADLTDPTVQEPEDPAVVAVQQAMREDLAGRLEADPARISIASYRDVTWPDACLGVTEPGQACAEMLMPGFRALLEAPDGNGYWYHGTSNEFIATDFLPEGTEVNPFPLPAQTPAE